MDARDVKYRHVFPLGTQKRPKQRTASWTSRFHIGPVTATRRGLLLNLVIQLLVLHTVRGGAALCTLEYYVH